MSFTIRHLLEDIPAQREMRIQEQTVFEQFLGAITMIIQAHRVEAREVIINDLSEATEVEGLIDPSIPDRDINIWRWCALAFERQNDLVSAEKVIESCYNKMNQEGQCSLNGNSPNHLHSQGLQSQASNATSTI